ncbi:CidA/LrgA family protein [Geomesophilobacter sediminis]|uniref:CidA/LrgA family protein n=1 Tax=Geomesophilobacter sediminis TaxID=2798584 RepID=A0A8J7M0M1_9BACT|nr:CidA/LrgA family protein [Geomesophilobacter sediminis]MBJ6725907.1 CidA/LrgA family protein [Geomesophilobacter sediminis]
MNRYRTVATWRRHFRASAVLQILLLLALWQVGELVVRLTRLPLPGAIAGLFILLALLGTKRLSVCSVRRGASWFLAEMLLFFVPAVMAVLDHPELFGLQGVKILLVILTSTCLVMIVTAGVIDAFYRIKVSGEDHVPAID